MKYWNKLVIRLKPKYQKHRLKLLVVGFSSAITSFAFILLDIDVATMILTGLSFTLMCIDEILKS